jgi:hypothetical protein
MGTCPMMQPNNNSMCSTLGENCPYPGMMGNTNQCTCETNGWRCSSCPANQPMTGGMCQPTAGGGALLCDYGGQECVCGFNGQWSCSTCPAMQPMQNSACMPNNLFCAYANEGCRCVGVPAKWNCTAQVTCPPSQPAPGSTCMGNLQCPYMGHTCICQMGQFFCN